MKFHNSNSKVDVLRHRTVVAMLLAILLSVGAAQASEPAATPIGDAVSFSATGVDGKAYAVPANSARATVLIFILHDCPICNRYAPEIGRIAAEYGKHNVSTFVVYEDSDVTPAQARLHAKEYGLTCGLLYDPRHVLARRVGAVATPEAVVLEAGGSPVYRGRIDDRFRGCGIGAVGEPASRDLRASLDSVLKGVMPQPARTSVVGCAIPLD